MSYYYHYTCDGISDCGWGCVYRCAQSWLAAHGEEVLSLPQMMERIGIHMSERRTDMWIEPVDVHRHLVPPSRPARLAAWTRQMSTGPSIMRRSDSWDDYPLRTASEHEIIDLLCRASPAVADDGICAFFVVRADADGPVVADPHTVTGPVVPRQWTWTQFFGGRSLWMLMVSE